jgi:hypothetical protein
MGIPRWFGVLLFVGLSVVLGCDVGVQQVDQAAAPTVDTRVPEPWITKPTSEWPQFVLTNQAEFTGHTPLHGASSFLVQGRGEQIHAATAKHLIGSAGGVEPPIPVDQLAVKLQHWRMFPRTNTGDFLEIAGPVAGTPATDEVDWLLLAVKRDSRSLPATPLKPRQDGVRVGERVYLVGCPYRERDCSQNVYSGVVTKREYNDYFRYSVSPPVDLRGFSGAPILDEKGYVVGVFMLWFEAERSGEDYVEGGGEDIATIYDVIQNAE